MGVKKKFIKNEIIAIRISNVKKDKLKAISSRFGQSLSYTIEKCIDDFLKKYDE